MTDAKATSEKQQLPALQKDAEILRFAYESLQAVQRRFSMHSEENVGEPGSRIIEAAKIFLLDEVLLVEGLIWKIHEEAD